MIASLSGRIVARGASFAIIDVHGVGFRVLMSTASLSALPSDGTEARVLTYLHVREDELSLYGFTTHGEREAFEALLGVSGVGPKVALAVLSALSPDELATAVATGDVALISSVQGIGSKTAQRMIVDLAGRLQARDAPSRAQSGASIGSIASEVREALLGMGFSPAEAANAVNGASGETVAEVLRSALARLGGGR